MTTPSPIPPEIIPSGPVSNPVPSLLTDLINQAEILEKMPNRPPKRLTETKRGNKQVAKQRNRRGKAFTPFQYSALISCLRAESYPNRDQVLNVAQFVGLAPDRVKVWFQNARVRGVSQEAGIVELKVTAEQILDGTAPKPIEEMGPAGPQATPPVETEPVPVLAMGVQCDIIPPALIRLFESNALSSIIKSTTADLISTGDYETMTTAEGEGK